MPLPCRVIIVLIFIFFSVMLPGCMKPQAEVEKEILKSDPSFRDTLNKRNLLRQKLKTQQDILQKKEHEIGGGISALKKERVTLKRKYAATVDELKRQIEPEKRQIRQKLADIRRSNGRKNAELRDIKRDIKEISTLLKKKDTLLLTQEEIRTWNDRISSLTEKKAAKKSERDKLKKEIKITRMKLRVLKL